MSAIDISVSPELNAMLTLPSCSAISLPQPSSPLQIQLPGGGTLMAFSDLSKGLPTDCAMVFSLLSQLGPFLASIECLVKLLKLAQTAVDALQGATTIIGLISGIGKIIGAAGDVLDCAASFTPLGLIPFIRDVLLLIIKALRCFQSQLSSVVGTLKQVQSQMTNAQQAGNAALLASLTCAQTNAFTQAQYMTSSLQGIGIIMGLAGDLMKIVNVSPVSLPSIGSSPGVEELEAFTTAIGDVITILQDAVTALGG
jgi:hypothetical protein